MELKWLWQNSDKEMKFFSRMCLLETRRAWLIMCMCSRAHAQKAISNDSWTQSTTKKTYISASVLGAPTDPHFARFYPCSDASCWAVRGGWKVAHRPSACCSLGALQRSSDTHWPSCYCVTRSQTLDVCVWERESERTMRRSARGGCCSVLCPKHIACIFLLHTHSEKTESICFCWQETDRFPGSRNNLPCLYKCGCLYYISKCKREEIKKRSL